MNDRILHSSEARILCVNPKFRVSKVESIGIGCIGLNDYQTVEHYTR